MPLKVFLLLYLLEKFYFSATAWEKALALKCALSKELPAWYRQGIDELGKAKESC